MHPPPRLSFAAAMASIPGFQPGLDVMQLEQRPRGQQVYSLPDDRPDAPDGVAEPVRDGSPERPGYLPKP